jgi:GDP-D-mannose dehydratase
MLTASTSEVYGDAQESPQTEGYWGNVSTYSFSSVYLFV